MNKYSILLFKALSDETRLRIVRYVAKKHIASCKEISIQFKDLSQPTMSHHFKILAEAGILLIKKEGTENIYTLDTAYIKNNGIDIQKI